MREGWAEASGDVAVAASRKPASMSRTLEQKDAEIRRLEGALQIVFAAAGSARMATDVAAEVAQYLEANRPGAKIGGCPTCGVQLKRTGHVAGEPKGRYQCMNSLCRERGWFNRWGERR